MGVNTFMNNQSFGKFIKTARETLGLTQEGLAAKSGLSQATISRIELDKQTNLTEDTRNVLLSSLGINAISIPIPQIKQIPVISWVHAGLFAEPVDTWPNHVSEEGESVISYETVGPCAFALRVVGDSMEPRYFPGDTIIVDPGIRCDNDCPCVVWLNGEVSFKIFKETEDEVRLHPLNDRYPDTTIKKDSRADFKIIGKVVEMRPKL